MAKDVFSVNLRVSTQSMRNERLSIRLGKVQRSKWRMRGGRVRHPERAQRNIRLVLLRGAGGLGDTPR
jgi:hypothetical protein